MKENHLKNFGKFISDFRKGQGLTQNDLLQKLIDCGVGFTTQSMLSQIESGQFLHPNRNFLMALAKALSLDFDIIMMELVDDKYGWKPKIIGLKKKTVIKKRKIKCWVKTT